MYGGVSLLETSAEVLDLSADSDCQAVPDVPGEAMEVGLTGGPWPGHGFYVCFNDWCHFYQGSQKKAEVKLFVKRAHSSSAIFDNALILMGGS